MHSDTAEDGLVPDDDLQSHESESPTTMGESTLATASRERHHLAPATGASHLAHHFDSSVQQHEAAKLGMWLFLATEVLLFGGLFCLYAVFRGNNPEIFDYGSQFLDIGWGAINTAVLIISSLTMAIAVWCAQSGHQRGLIVFLALTLVCATDFLGVKIIEYSHKFHDNLVWGVQFYEDPHQASRPQPVAEPTLEDVIELEPGDAAAGRSFFRFTCAGCHGARGQGLPNSGKPLSSSDFVSGLDDASLLEFLKTGRPANDPLNTTGIAMLPRGGNLQLSDQDLAHIVQFVRVLQTRATLEPGTPQQPDAVAAAPSEAEEEFVIPKSFIPDAARGSSGLSVAALEAPKSGRRPTHQRAEVHDPQTDPDRPANAHVFFGVYFLMTGLHGLHVLAGMIVITWLLVRAFRGDFSRRYFTPVDLGGLYWHVVDVIWIFLFPLLYLIH